MIPHVLHRRTVLRFPVLDGAKIVGFADDLAVVVVGKILKESKLLRVICGFRTVSYDPACVVA